MGGDRLWTLERQTGPECSQTNNNIWYEPDLGACTNKLKEGRQSVDCRLWDSKATPWDRSWLWTGKSLQWDNHHCNIVSGY